MTSPDRCVHCAATSGGTGSPRRPSGPGPVGRAPRECSYLRRGNSNSTPGCVWRGTNPFGSMSTSTKTQTNLRPGYWVSLQDLAGKSRLGLRIGGALRDHQPNRGANRTRYEPTPLEHASLPFRPSFGRDSPPVQTPGGAIRSRNGRPGPGSVRQRAIRLLPGVDTAMDVARGLQPRIVRGPHRHRRAFAEGAIEQQPAIGGGGSSNSIPPGWIFSSRSEYGACSDPGIDPCFCRSVFSRRSISTVSLQPTIACARAASTAQPSRDDVLLREALAHGSPGPRRPSSSDWHRFNPFISATYSSTYPTCRRGLQRFSSPIVLTVSPL